MKPGQDTNRARNELPEKLLPSIEKLQATGQNIRPVASLAEITPPQQASLLHTPAMAPLAAAGLVEEPSHLLDLEEAGEDLLGGIKAFFSRVASRTTKSSQFLKKFKARLLKAKVDQASGEVLPE